MSSSEEHPKLFKNLPTMDICIFCTATCDHRQFLPSLDFKPGDEPIQQNLQALFVLKHVLKVPQEKIFQFLSQNEAHSNPSTWFYSCPSCEQSVHRIFEALKQISKLERKLVEKIQWSEMDNQYPHSIWAQIRSEVLNAKPEAEIVVEALDIDNSPMDVVEADDSHFEIEEEPPQDGNLEFKVPLDNVMDEEWNIIKEQHPPDSATPSSFWFSESDSDESAPVPKKRKLLKATKSRDEVKLKKKRNRKRENIIRQWDMSNPNYIFFSRGNKSFYGCRQCPTKYQELEKLEIHLKFHGEQSPKVPRPENEELAVFAEENHHNSEENVEMIVPDIKQESDDDNDVHYNLPEESNSAPLQPPLYEPPLVWNPPEVPPSVIAIPINVQDGPGNCPLCNKRFGNLSRNVLTTHIRIEHDANGKDPSTMVHCPGCSAPFTHPIFLERHIKADHKQPKEPGFQCGICNKKLSSFKSLESHIQSQHKYFQETPE